MSGENKIKQNMPNNVLECDFQTEQIQNLTQISAKFNS